VLEAYIPARSHVGYPRADVVDSFGYLPEIAASPRNWQKRLDPARLRASSSSTRQRGLAGGVRGKPPPSAATAAETAFQQRTPDIHSQPFSVHYR
jgi:hypothetical protein